MREPTRRPPIERPGWNDQAAVALLVLVAGHLLAVEPAAVARPLTPDRLSRFVAAHDRLSRFVAAHDRLSRFVAAHDRLSRFVAAHDRLSRFVAAHDRLSRFVAAHDLPALVAAHDRLSRFVAAHDRLSRFVAAHDRLSRFVAAHDLPALVAACEGNPSEQARHGAHQLRRLIRAGQAQVYQRVLPGLPVALVDPYFRLALARAAARAGLDLFPSTSPRP